MRFVYTDDDIKMLSYLNRVAEKHDYTISCEIESDLYTDSDDEIDFSSLKYAGFSEDDIHYLTQYAIIDKYHETIQSIHYTLEKNAHGDKHTLTYVNNDFYARLCLDDIRAHKSPAPSLLQNMELHDTMCAGRDYELIECFGRTVRQGFGYPCDREYSNGGRGLCEALQEFSNLVCDFLDEPRYDYVEGFI